LKESLSFHPVSTAVGNVKNQDPSLVMPVELSTESTSPQRKKKVMVSAASQNMMASWLKKKELKQEDKQVTAIIKEEKVASPQVEVHQQFS
jgi:hypothetical protein